MTPPIEMPLEEAMEVIEQTILPPLERQGMFEQLEVRLAGTADKLKETARVLAIDFVL
nr:hypothetical protein [Desulfuromonadales bacterium]